MYPVVHFSAFDDTNMKPSDKTRADLGWDALCTELAARTRTPRGGQLARALALLSDADAARARHAEVSEARALRDTDDALPLDGVKPIDDELARAGKGGLLDPAVLRDVASTLRAGAATRGHLLTHGGRAPRLLGRAALIAELDEVSQPIDDAFEEGEARDEDGAPRPIRLRDRASPSLGGLRRRARAVRDELERKISSLLDASHVSPHLQDRFFTQREDRYVLPVRTDARQRVRGIVHGTSSSGQTFFVEPEEIVDLNNRLKWAELEVAEEERRILAELSQQVTEALPHIAANLEILAALDLIDASARLSSDLRASVPEISEGGGELDLRRARHPLMVLAGHRCVPNDIVVARGAALVISGPNAGGKTVALKTAGLAALMARAGLHVPAQEGSRVPLFDDVLSDVGDDQSLERNLSTFSAHVMALCRFFAAARPGVLVLLDEVAVGTEPEQGAALAQAVLEALVARGATVIVTTHYDRLKALPTRDRRFVNASVGFDVDKLAPTYELHLGIPGASGALVVARRLGLDGATCDRARALLSEEQQGLEQLLIDLEGDRKRIEGERAAALAERERAESARRDAERAAGEAKERLAQARKHAHDEAIETLQKARSELDRTRTVLRRSGGQVTAAEVATARREIDAAAREVHQAAPAPAAPAGRPATAADLTVGATVWVQRLGGRGTIVGAPKNGKLPVQAGVLKVTVAVDEVFIPDQKLEKSARARRGHNAFDAAPAPAPATRGGHRTLDVRGERVDAAVGLAEKFLDDALRADVEAVWVVHGHGTGVLRDALRAQLAGFPGVSGVRAGAPDEGGDGVTVITLGG
jgi:DNA mismatch repair protein MutS2